MQPGCAEVRRAQHFPRRPPNVREQIAFIRGVHSCPGAPLARAEGRISLNRILDRMTDIRISEEHHGPADARRYAYEPTFIMRGLAELHIEFKGVDTTFRDCDPRLTVRLVEAVRPISKAWFRWEVRGLESFPAAGGALVVSNTLVRIGALQVDRPGKKICRSNTVTANAWSRLISGWHA